MGAPEFAFKAAPYPTSRDLLRHLRAEAGPEHQPLITDLFEKITLYYVKVTGARKQQRADGTWDVAVEIDARKLYADGEGRESEAALDEPFESGSSRPNRAESTSAGMRCSSSSAGRSTPGSRPST